jgi:DNA-binding CsgD family transcriptional regulator
VLRAHGSAIEREFGFGVVRQLFGRAIRTLPTARRNELLEGPAALAAPIFGQAGRDAIETNAAEASLYGLFWLVVGLAEDRPLVITIDDAHWSDTASLRFVHYLARRLGELPVLLALTARPNEPDAEVEMLRGLTTALNIPVIRPALLSEAATETIVRRRLGPNASEEVIRACHLATGGNPLLVSELLAELEADDQGVVSITADVVATMGAERIAAELTVRALGVSPCGPAVLQAVAVLGDGSNVATIAALAEVERKPAAATVDGLAAISILTHDFARGFAHPLLQNAVYNAIPMALRGMLHSRAAGLLAARGASAEEIAAHLLLCEPGSSSIDAADVLSEAASRAAERGAAESVIAYLRRALSEVSGGVERGELLHRLGGAEIALRDVASIDHLRQAAQLTDDPPRAISISLELIDVLSIAGQWEATVETVDAALRRFADTRLPGVLDLEAARVASRFYDPARVNEYERDLPRLRALVEDRADEESRHLRWVLGAVDAIRGAPRSAVLDLLGPFDHEWTLRRRGRESSFGAQAMFALLTIDADQELHRVTSALRVEGRQRGSLLAMIFASGLEASVDARRGRLAASEENLGVTVELIEANELSLMALTTFLHTCQDTIAERSGLAGLADLVEGLELPPPFGGTQSGAMVAEARAVIRTSRGDRTGAIADLRSAAEIYAPLQAGPRITHWRSRLAVALPESARAEALELVEHELELANSIESARAQGVALRAMGVVRGGESGLEHLRQSVAILRGSNSPLETARSLAELGAALRRGNQRVKAREHLREAAQYAQRCGAETLERRVDEELRVAGAKPRRRALTGVDSLTPGERRVAVAAAGGATNREIAQDLFVSLRTVEMHLTNAYRKLGISSRGELAISIVSRS